MPLWVWIAFSLAGVLVLSLFFFRVRYSLDWSGGLRWSGTFKYGFPGFSRVLHFPTVSSVAPPRSIEPSVSSAPAAERDSTALKSRSRAPGHSGRNRARRTLFKLLTDPIAIRVLIRCGLRWAGLTFRLLNLELDCALGNSDPALLGRMAGYWYAAEPLLPTRRVHCHFRFQDRSSTLKLSAQGGFSAAHGFAYVFMLLFSFPWWTLSRRAWHGWRNS